MELSPLTAISPIDGRYRKLTEKLYNYFSEYALIRERIKVEIEYFISLCEIPLPELKNFKMTDYSILRSIYRNFNIQDAEQIKEIEKITNHDVKAIEYFLKEKFKARGLDKYKEFIHFGLTTWDIHSPAITYTFKCALNEVIYPEIERVINKLKELGEKWKDIPMLARTHGQPASPTRLGKEINVFVERLENQMKLLRGLPFSAKLGGATGNFNAHHIAYPTIDWIAFANKFLKSLGLERLQTTTQIEHYDNLSVFFDNLRRINTILIDLNRDIWLYISMDYFKQKFSEGETGSSTMPHKVNPIDFENSEGNLGIANALFEHLSAKLPISRLQRDLTDSTVIRNIGVPLAHTQIALKSLTKGLNKLQLNKQKIRSDLSENWVVVAEAIQTILRKEGYPEPYETLKNLTRTPTLSGQANKKIDKQTIHKFIDTLKISRTLKTKLKSITPFNYIGI